MEGGVADWCLAGVEAGCVAHVAGDVMINRELHAAGEPVKAWFAHYGLFLNWGKLTRHARRELPA